MQIVQVIISIFAAQEVTPAVYERLQCAPWWGLYVMSPCVAPASYATLIGFRHDTLVPLGPDGAPCASPHGG